jgi:uncharacterized protein
MLQPLKADEEGEALAFLAARPIHTVIMASLIRDNGLESPLNRGTFYGCRDAGGRLTGLGLIGHLVLTETRTDEALAALAAQTRSCARARLIMGEEARIERFWQHYAAAGQVARHVNQELLLEMRCGVSGLDAGLECVPDFRPATCADLEGVLSAHAELARSESGVDPLTVDPEGFRARTVRRIEQGRVWVWVDAGRLIFKADVVAETPEVVYLEGVYVDPLERGKRYGLRCLSQLCRGLLGRTQAICLLVNQSNLRAQEFYWRAGFATQSRYSTIFLRPQS